jgi:hypothetical protein
MESGKWFLLAQMAGKSLAIFCSKCTKPNLLRCRERGWVRCGKCGLIWTAPESHLGLPIIPSKQLHLFRSGPPYKF